MIRIIFGPKDERTKNGKIEKKTIELSWCAELWGTPGEEVRCRQRKAGQGGWGNQ